MFQHLMIILNGKLWIQFGLSTCAMNLEPEKRSNDVIETLARAEPMFMLLLAKTRT